MPVGSLTRASRPYGVSWAGSTIVPPSSVTCCERRVDVRDLEVDVPAGRLVRVVHDPGEGVLVLPERRVAELVRVAHHVRVPAEHVAVERHRVVVRTRVELEPRRRPGLAGHLEPLHLVRLPRADDGAPRVLDHREAAVLGDLHRRHLDGSAVTPRGVGDPLDVVGHQMDAPRVRIAGRPVVRHAAGDVLPVLREREVAAEPLVRRLGLPAEEPTVELGRLVGVRAVQVDPARGTDDERWCGHVCLPCRVSRSNDRLAARKSSPARNRR